VEVKELDSIQSSYKGYKISDSDGLFGDIRVLQSGKVSIDFKYSFKWEGKHELTDI